MCVNLRVLVTVVCAFSAQAARTDSRPGCTKVQARWLCKLPLDGWEDEESGSLKDSDLQCIATLCGNQIGNCCKKRALLISHGVSESSLPLSADGLKEFQKWNPAPKPIHIVSHDAEPIKKTCPGGNFNMAFDSLNINVYAPHGKEAGDLFTAHCGSRAVNKDAELKLVCKATNEGLYWSLQEGSCVEQTGCQASDMTIIVEHEKNPSVVSMRTKLAFDLPFTPNKFGQKVSVQSPCPRSAKVLGGVTTFYCLANGHWEVGAQECEWAESVVETPDNAPQGKADPVACGKVEFTVSFGNGRFQKFDLPKAKQEGQIVTKDCSGETSGQVVFECAGGRWNAAGGSCRAAGVCAHTNFNMKYSFGSVEFDLPETPLSEEVEVDCAKSGPYQGTVQFRCSAGASEGKWNLSRGACAKTEGDSAAVTFTTKEHAACKNTRFTLTFGGGRKQMFTLPASEEGKVVEQACDQGLYGEVSFKCQQNTWRKEGGSCKPEGACAATSMSISHPFGDVRFQLPETKASDQVVLIECSKAGSYTGKVGFKCTPEGKGSVWSLEAGGGCLQKK